MATYGVYGFGLRSDFPFANHLAPWSGAPDLTFACRTDPPVAVDWGARIPVYRSTRQTEEGESAFLAYRLDDGDVLRLTGIADFYVGDDRITCHLLEPGREFMVEIALLGTVLSYWMERRGIPALHASGVVVEGRALGFVSTNKGGKSGLAADFMKAGYPLLTDDILPLQEDGGTFWARPGYPTMRMWPTEAEYFLGRWEDLEIVYPGLEKRRVPVGEGEFGTLCDAPRPLTCLYLPERRDPEDGVGVEILPLSSAASVMALVRHSFISRLVEAMGWQKRRLACFARLLTHIPVRRLRYPSGFEHLGRTRDAMLADLEGLRSVDRSG